MRAVDVRARVKWECGEAWGVEGLAAAAAEGL